MDVIAFTKVSLPYGWLGNMSPHPIVFLGKTWRTAEALFQARRFDDPGIRMKIFNEKSPMSAKMVAKKYQNQMAIAPMSVLDVINMEIVVRLKIAQHDSLRKMLTETGNRVIVEDVTGRSRVGNHRFWGAALEDGRWVGENRLGKIWMCLRHEIVEDKVI